MYGRRTAPRAAAAYARAPRDHTALRPAPPTPISAPDRAAPSPAPSPPTRPANEQEHPPAPAQQHRADAPATAPSHPHADAPTAATPPNEAGNAPKASPQAATTSATNPTNREPPPDPPPRPPPGSTPGSHQRRPASTPYLQCAPTNPQVPFARSLADDPGNRRRSVWKRGRHVGELPCTAASYCRLRAMRRPIRRSASRSG